MRFQKTLLVVSALSTTVFAETACTGIYCGCEEGYCWKANLTTTPVSYLQYRFCGTTEHCLKGCVNQKCQVMDDIHVIPVDTDISCTVNADCFHYIPTVKPPRQK
ncbi:hypothetical protein BDV3_006686 [Batrachochytrium dendrobatidis]|uniref:Uncharacterized protein n=1 Tax=Batrachochytrium dendrobatidis (strain JEL423) TaxID=403673 RepID=A0A177WRM6_BATDL|nr:hypothetical protein O5D80_008564 [Batrachochytrium dendrobatidis]KAK5665625.1 hypothetical protein QVD99_007274 [Batrachochytrium dendrobatidis]OAJ42552.1 hypothetical protein BDEG_26001 [Batrachochytrium dendrobatidis JEL423]